MLFFGCSGQAGHFLFNNDGYKIDINKYPFPPYELDSRFAPKTEKYQDERATKITHINNWTILAMWDRSIDTRGNSNAAFLQEGTLTEIEMWDVACKEFRKIVFRLKAGKGKL